MVGESKAIQQIKDMIDRVAPTDARVLITGANGTGKELVARWLHE
jgi:DNA-binding NtrC family response regulator